MKVLVTGSLGMLARDLIPRLEQAGLEVVGFDLPELDITEPGAVMSGLQEHSPELLINCAAYTAVDRAESEPEVAEAVNASGPAHLANACRESAIPLLHLSTDYVFDGESERPYREDDPAGPLSVYGRTKWQGEQAVRGSHALQVIVRTAWLYGVHGSNFVKTMLRLAREKEELKVVADQFGCPTWTRDLADALVVIAKRIPDGGRDLPWGTYHFCGSGRTSWYEFAGAIFEEARRHEKLKIACVRPICTEEYPTAARRPKCSVMDCSRIAAAFGIRPRPWRDALIDMLALLLDNGES